MFNKKGDVTFRSIMFVFVKFIIVILVLSTIIGFVNRFVYFDSDTTSLESEIFFQSLMRSPQGPSFYDTEAKRLYPYTVDLDFFTDYKGQLEKVFNYSKDYIAAKITLQGNDGKSVINGQKIEPVYYNKKKYEIWDEIAKMKIKETSRGTGPGDIKNFNKQYYVTIKKGDKIFTGNLNVRILMLKS
ncbi:MAG: hypothetical protein ACQESF_00250 [Nanobdellota archaeon]